MKDEADLKALIRKRGETMPFTIIRNDITKVAADAIVNTANPQPIYGGGTDYAVYKAAGADLLLAQRRKIGPIRPGQAAYTEGFRLPAKYIIHTVGPAWEGGSKGEFDILRSCYDQSMKLAKKLGCKSLAFPLISTGTYGFPKDKALTIATTAISSFLLEEEEMEIILVVFDKKSFSLSGAYADEIREYIDNHYADRHKNYNYRPRASEASYDMAVDEVMAPLPTLQSGARKGSPRRKRKLSDLVDNVGETFQQKLFRLIDEKGMTDAQVYKRANVDRKQFSKIRCNPDYRPGKRTVVALALALKLNLDETVDLLSRLGYAFSPASKADLIVEYCIENGIYDIFEINSILFEYDEALLGGVVQDHAG